MSDEAKDAVDKSIAALREMDCTACGMIHDPSDVCRQRLKADLAECVALLREVYAERDMPPGDWIDRAGALLARLGEKP